MTETPTPKQALILWCLLGRHGAALQSEIVPRIDKADREALVSGRFLESARQGRSLRLTVTEKGWAWASDHMRDPLPAGARALQDWLGLIRRHLDAVGAPLAELVGLPPEPEAAPVPKPRPSGRAAAAGTRARAAPETKSVRTKAITPRKLRTRIEEAYLAISGGRKATAVRLSALRAGLPDLDRATVDGGLAAILKGDRTARLSQFTDPKSLDAAERAAAYSPAGEPFHILWIES